MRRGFKRLDTSTQGEYTKSKAAYENLKDFNVSKRQSQILPLRPAFLTTEAVKGNDMGDETLALILVNHDLQRELLPRSPSK